MEIDFASELADLLIGISGVGVAFAGFSSILVVLKSRDDQEWARLKSSTIKALLETSLTVSIFALFPLALRYLGISINIGLTALLIIFGLWHAYILMLAVRRDQRTAVHAFMGSPIIIFASLIIIIQFIVGFAGHVETKLAIYLAVLFWLLIMGALNFCILLYSTMNSEKSL